MIDVLSMSEEEAEALLERKLRQPNPDNRQLVRALDYMPLAIAQAAAYIRERASRCSVQQYCEEIERSRMPRMSLLRRHIPLPNRDVEASNSVLLTWHISFKHIYATRRSAAELLSLMSFCDRLAIPGQRSEVAASSDEDFCQESVETSSTATFDFGRYGRSSRGVQPRSLQGTDLYDYYPYKASIACYYPVSQGR